MRGNGTFERINVLEGQLGWCYDSVIKSVGRNSGGSWQLAKQSSCMICVHSLNTTAPSLTAGASLQSLSDSVSPRDSCHQETSRHRDAIHAVLPQRSPETYSLNTINR